MLSNKGKELEKRQKLEGEYTGNVDEKEEKEKGNKYRLKEEQARNVAGKERKGTQRREKAAGGV